MVLSLAGLVLGDAADFALPPAELMLDSLACEAWPTLGF